MTPRKLSGIGPSDPAPGTNTSELVPDADYAKVVRLGIWLLVIGFGGFMAWAVFAPLDEGVPMPGVVSVESKRKRVDHLAGGIIAKILVRDGQQVQAGDDLVVLDEVQTNAALNAIQSQWRVALATDARLSAERAALAAIQFPRELRDSAAEPEVSAVMRVQSELFRARREALKGELAIIRESVAGLEQQLKSLDQLGLGRQQQIQLFHEQLASFRKLHADNFVSRNQLIEVERQLAEVQTKQSEDLANIADVRARLAEFRMRGGQRDAEYRREVETQFADVQKEVATLGERMAALRDTSTRLALRAPVSGTVVDLAYHTIGGVIKPGDRILDIVPDGDELIIEAQLGPQYIDRVRAGLPADVHFDAYLRNIEPPVISGTVKVVSADVLTDPRTGAQFYALRVSVPMDELKKLKGLELRPGMQGTVMVKTGERTLLTYLLRPLFRRFNSALGER
jgi:HlyD family type I secretion membrane fusion protein